MEMESILITCDAKFSYIEGITITNIHDIPEWIKESKKVISLKEADKNGINPDNN
jgi:sulfur relay (sulfurtransferase) complex TusBCD TusD component (DsrE family)